MLITKAGKSHFRALVAQLFRCDSKFFFFWYYLTVSQKVSTPAVANDLLETTQNTKPKLLKSLCWFSVVVYVPPFVYGELVMLLKLRCCFLAFLLPAHLLGVNRKNGLLGSRFFVDVWKGDTGNWLKFAQVLYKTIMKNDYPKPLFFTVDDLVRGERARI